MGSKLNKQPFWGEQKEAKKRVYWLNLLDSLTIYPRFSRGTGSSTRVHDGPKWPSQRACAQRAKYRAWTYLPLVQTSPVYPIQDEWNAYHCNTKLIKQQWMRLSRSKKRHPLARFCICSFVFLAWGRMKTSHFVLWYLMIVNLPRISLIGCAWHKRNFLKIFLAASVLLETSCFGRPHEKTILADFIDIIYYSCGSVTHAHKAQRMRQYIPQSLFCRASPYYSLLTIGIFQTADFVNMSTWNVVYLLLSLIYVTTG